MLELDGWWQIECSWDWERQVVYVSSAKEDVGVGVVGVTETFLKNTENHQCGPLGHMFRFQLLTTHDSSVFQLLTLILLNIFNTSGFQRNTMST